MFKIYIDARQRKESEVFLFRKKLFFWMKLDRLTSEDPLSAVSEILKRNGLELKDISVFETFPGPGSFTGLRIGYSIINTLKHYVKGVPYGNLVLPKYGAEPNITPPKAKK